MSYAEELMAELKKPEADEQKPEETTVETPVETKEEKPEEQPEETPEEKPEDKPDEKPDEKPEEKPEEPQKEKPDLSTLTKEQKAEHAFKRQLNKQASKYENIIAEMNGKFEDVTKRLEELTKQKAESEKKPLTRDQFEYDDDFVRALVKQGMDEELAKQKADQEEERKNREKKEAEDREVREAQQKMADRFNENCKAVFSDEKSYSAFEKQLKKAADNGLVELLDQAPAVREYIFEQPDGPIVLNEILNSKESFVRVMSSASNPMMACITMHDLAREVSSRSQSQDSTTEKPKSTMPSLGKPGANRGTPSAGDMWSSDDELINFVRSKK